MKMYDYLIAYIFEKDGYLTHCSGTTTLRRKNKINSISDLQEIVEYLTESIDGAKNLSIYNIVLLGVNKV